jgi:hypothetical protein
VRVAYAVALAYLAAGVALGTGLVAGVGPVSDAWPWLKPAHAWLNLLGCVSLVVAATLIHLLPTVLGSRIRRRRSATALVAGLAVAPPLAAIGYAWHADVLVGGGALLEIAGAAALVAYVAGCIADRARWTTDAGWHRMTAGHLVAAAAWFTIGVVIVGWRVLAAGSNPDGWSLAAAGGPLVVGWVVQVILGAAGHIVPAVGPGDPLRHAAQRRQLGHYAGLRLVAFQAGVAAVTIGSLAGWDALAIAGVAVAGITAMATLLLLAGAMLLAAAPPRPGRPADIPAA